MATYKVYLTVHFETEIEADSLEQAEQLASGIDYDAMTSYDESDFRVEEAEHTQTAKLVFGDDRDVIRESAEFWGDDATEQLLDAEGDTVEVIEEITDGYYNIRLANGTEIDAINQDFLEFN